VAAVGYGAGTNVLFLDKASELAKNPHTTTLKRKVSDGAGGLVEVDEVMRVFVEPTASNGTPMAEAFKQAYTGVEKFISNHRDSFPPVVINITDGEPNDSINADAEALIKLLQFGSQGALR